MKKTPRILTGDPFKFLWTSSIKNGAFITIGYMTEER